MKTLKNISCLSCICGLLFLCAAPVAYAASTSPDVSDLLLPGKLEGDR